MFTHTPTTTTSLWLLLSLPLVAWDTAYVLLRPLTMPGGPLHSPIFTPYALYGTIDHVYGAKAFLRNSGFPSAQASLNALETLLYLVYWWAAKRGGRTAAAGVLVGFGAAVMTLSKTVLYWLHEYFSGFDNIGHNPPLDLIFLWIIPNGAWLIGPTYMIASLGGEIIAHLAPHAKTE